MSFLMLVVDAAAGLLALATMPLVAELTLVTIGNLLPQRRVFPSVRRCPVSSIMVIIPAHNEEDLVARTVKSVLESASRSSLRVSTLVIAHNCKDDTARAARTAGADVIEFDDPRAKGKGRALEVGFALAVQRQIDAVLVIDADSLVSENTLSELQARFDAGAEAAQCRYELCTVDASDGRPGTDLQALAFRAMNVVRARGRSGLGLSCGIFGNGFALRTDVLKRVPYRAFSLAEDLEYHLHLVLGHVRTTFVAEATIIGRSSSGSAGSAQRSRWEGGRLAIALRVTPGLLLRLCRGNYRLTEPIIDLLSLPLVLGFTSLCVLASMPVHWIHWYGLSALLVVFLHVGMAVMQAPDVRRTSVELFFLPWYIVRKLALIPMILNRARTGEGWARTSAQDEPSHVQ